MWVWWPLTKYNNAALQQNKMKTLGVKFATCESIATYMRTAFNLKSLTMGEEDENLADKDDVKK